MIALVLKTSEPRGSEGSNPSPSAMRDLREQERRRMTKKTAKTRKPDGDTGQDRLAAFRGIRSRGDRRPDRVGTGFFYYASAWQVAVLCGLAGRLISTSPIAAAATSGSIALLASLLMPNLSVFKLRQHHSATHRRGALRQSQA